jgi:hypothetical protein
MYRGDDDDHALLNHALTRWFRPHSFNASASAMAIPTP